MPDKNVSAIVCMGGPIYRIHVGSHSYYFEMHRILGPMPVDGRTFDERVIDPEDWIHGKFWWAVTLWAQQGRQTGLVIRPRGVRPQITVCVWTSPPGRAPWRESIRKVRGEE